MSKLPYEYREGETVYLHLTPDFVADQDLNTELAGADAIIYGHVNDTSTEVLLSFRAEDAEARFCGPVVHQSEADEGAPYWITPEERLAELASA